MGTNLRISITDLGARNPLLEHKSRFQSREISVRRGEIDLHPDDSVTFDWFVKEKYLPLRRGKWSTATKKKTEFEIHRYLVENLKATSLRNIGLFELQTLVNNLAETYSDSIVRQAFANLKSILKVAKKLKVLAENPGEDLRDAAHAAG